MRKIFVSVLGVLAMVMGMAAFAVAPAQAATLPPDANGYKFWSPYVCVDGSAINGDYYRVAYIAQQWNIRSGYNLHLDYEDDCVAAGYPPSRSMVIGSYTNNTDGYCLTFTNQQTEGYGGFARWTNRPGAYVNFGGPGTPCIQNQTYRDHIVSEAIGYLIGLKMLNSTGYNSRVMNGTTWSWQNVPLPDVNSGSTVANIYTNVYCQPVGTAC